MVHAISLPECRKAGSGSSAWRCPKARHLVRVARSNRRDLLLSTAPLLAGPALAAAPSQSQNYLENVTPFARPAEATRVRAAP